MYLFSWDNVPGKDNGKLIEYLEQKYGVDWVRTAKIEKIDNNEIRIATEKNFLSLRLNNENTKVTLTINKVKTDEFIVKKENSKLNIYKDTEQEKKDIRQGVKVKDISYPYSLLGGLVLAGLIVVVLMGYYGTQSAGIFSPREAFLRDRSFHTHPDCRIGVPVLDAAGHYQRPQDPRGGTASRARRSAGKASRLA